MTTTASTQRAGFVRRTLHRHPIREAYRATSWASRLLAFGLSAALVTVIAWQFSGAQPLPTLAVLGGIAVALHALLSWGYWVRIALVWALNIVAVPVVASLYIALAPVADAAWLYVESVVISLLASALFTVIAVRWARGRLWVTLTLAFAALNLGGALLTSVLSIHSGGAWIGVGLGVLVLALRCAFPRHRAVAPAAAVSEDMQHRVLRDLEKGGYVAVRHEATGVIVATDRAGHLSVVHLASGEISPAWLAERAEATVRVVGRRAPALTVIAVEGDAALDRARYRAMALSAPSGRSLGVVALISARHAAQGLRLALDDARPTPVSREVLEQVRARIA